jgi:hypothetical protein
MKSSVKIFHWLPRIICILAILFVSLFAADSFNTEYTVWQQLGAFFMHLIPSFVLLFLLYVAWKKEYIGGIIFTFIGLVMSPFIFLHNYNVNHFSIGQSLGVILIVNFPFIIAGVLFIISSYIKKRENLKA